MDIFSVALMLGEFLDFFGVIIIVGGIILATVHFLYQYFFVERPKNLYNTYRQNNGKAILLGLEILVAGDIIRTVVGQPSFNSILILAAIVLIRTFLSINFDVEVNGKWPWQKSPRNTEERI